MSQAIKILLLDGATDFINRFGDLLAREPGMLVVARCRDRKELRDAILRRHPGAIVVGVDGPNDPNLQILRRLRENYPVPVIALIHASRRQDRLAVQAIEEGALDALLKPAGGGPELQALARSVAERLRQAAAQARLVPSHREQLPQAPPSFLAAGLNPRRFIVLAGASTGGPQALHALLKQLPRDFPPIVVVQHMPAMFTGAFATRLDGACAVHVSEAIDGESCVPGRVLLARGDTHLTVVRAGDGWRVRYTNQQKVDFHCPSVNVLFSSAVRAAGERAIGVLLTGMGADGAKGLLELRRAGALTIVQDARSCVVFGMPKAAMELDAADYAGRPEDIPNLIVQALAARVPARPNGES